MIDVSLTAPLAALAAAVAAGATVAAFEYRDEPGGLAAVAFMAAILWWSAGLFGEAVAATEAGKLFWLNVQYPATAVVPVAAVAFVASYLGYDAWLSRRRLLALAAPLAALTLLSWTNEFHGLVRTGTDLVAFGSGTVLFREFGPAWWAGWLYSQLLLVATFATLAYGVYDSASAFRASAGLLLVGAGAPWGAQFVVLGGGPAFRPELLFVLTGVAFTVAVRRGRTLGVTPVARQVTLKAIPDPIVVVDRSGRIADTNPAARAWLGDDVAVGAAAADALATAPEVYAAYRRGEAPDKPLRIEVDGEPRFVSLSAVSLPTLGSRSQGTVLLLRDVTESERNRRDLEVANDRLQTLTHALAHDIKNPLTVADGFTDLATAGDEAAIERVEGAHDRIFEIVDETLAAVDHPDPDDDAESFSLATLAEEAWRTAETGSATLAVAGDESYVADRAAVRSVLENLYRNASVHAGPDPTVTAVALDGGFAVVDDGPGIPPVERDRAFDRGRRHRDRPRLRRDARRVARVDRRRRRGPRRGRRRLAPGRSRRRRRRGVRRGLRRPTDRSCRGAGRRRPGRARHALGAARGREVVDSAARRPDCPGPTRRRARRRRPR
ncbi:signal-transducing histidine kinase [Halorubrum californiense DSM 19288]|uniref:histidine kinase n=1 Tax=Halorubrum californiense DSM 19288 TaxID=1227465 RepID=M0E4N1_9EURY|nr:MULTISPECIES: histidine kinase N-terminal 7TM domain-containing protein [Halorubrum]ELZ41334.1 signal-transducing histidine kinase [Halorubrum californiense DSM 19288]